jgi:hypothetical protein
MRRVRGMAEEAGKGASEVERLDLTGMAEIGYNGKTT